MSMAFVCERCDESAEEVVMRFCRACKKSVIAGYSCACGHEDIDPPGKEWGHACSSLAATTPPEPASPLPDAKGQGSAT